MGLQLFIDGSVDSQLGLGCGAMLMVEAEGEESLEDLKGRVRCRSFDSRSSTRLELETFLWAIGTVECVEGKLTVYSDSQNLLSLLERRNRIEGKAYCSSAGRSLANADVYRKFYDAHDRLGFGVVKVSGHTRTEGRSRIQALFALVDKAARQCLRGLR